MELNLMVKNLVFFFNPPNLGFENNLLWLLIILMQDRSSRSITF